jgi:tetratricopeptide (TPR) repeat protein
LAFLKSQALEKLGRTNESAAFLREIIVRVPNVARLHLQLSMALYDFADHGRNKNMLEESLQHVTNAAQIAPDDYQIVQWAAFVSRIKGDYASALRYGKQALALASTVEDKLSALQGIANTYVRNGLYSDARSYLREAMQLDECNVDVIADMAHCYYMEDNFRESSRMAKQGLMLDPSNEPCKKLLGYCEKAGTS